MKGRTKLSPIQPKEDKLIDVADKLLKYYNTLVALVVSGDIIISTALSTEFLSITLLIESGDYAGALKFLTDTGLFEKLGDAAAHFVNGKVTKDSSRLLIAFAMSLDAARIAMGYYYGKNNVSQIPTTINMLDLGLNHTLNFAANGARMLANYFGLFATNDQVEMSNANVVSSNLFKNRK